MLGYDFYWGEKLIIQLVDEEDKSMIFRVVATMLTKKRNLKTSFRRILQRCEMKNPK